MEQFTSMSTQGTPVASFITAMGCTACFASLASALGLGVFSQFEGNSIHYILPLFALIGLAASLPL